MSCRYITEKGIRFFLPDCMGGAVYGKRGCTCLTKNDEEKLLNKIKKLEQEINNIKSFLKIKRSDPELLEE